MSHPLNTKLFSPFSIKSLSIPNRIVMAPMTRSFSPAGIPGENVAQYYRRRALGEVGLIITEGTTIDDPAAGFDPQVPHFHGEKSLAGWKNVVDTVHQAGGKIMPQLWHVGITTARQPIPAGVRPQGPSGIDAQLKAAYDPMSSTEIANIIKSFATSAWHAQQLGFDGIELHGAHGYLIDQFFWDKTNKRLDKFGGTLQARTQFAVEIIQAVRQRVGESFPIILRFSQWKQQDYSAKLAQTEEELATFLQPLSAAGVDIFHCSTRRFWESEFPESGKQLNLAGWTKKITGKPVITVGSVSLNDDFIHTFKNDVPSAATGIEQILEGLEKEEFDLVAVGRSLIANPNWPQLIKSGREGELRPYHRDMLKELI